MSKMDLLKSLLGISEEATKRIDKPLLLYGVVTVSLMVFLTMWCSIVSSELPPIAWGILSFAILIALFYVIIKLHSARQRLSEGPEDSVSPNPETHLRNRSGQAWPEHYVQTASLESVSHFTGREKELKQLQDAVGNEEKNIAVIWTAGQVKSSLITRGYQDKLSRLKVAFASFIGTVLFVFLILFLPLGWWTWALVLGTGVFILVMWLNPIYWYFRIGLLCVTSVTAIVAVPAIKMSFKFGEDSLGSLTVGQPQAVVSIALLGVAILCFILDYKTRGGTGKTKKTKPGNDSNQQQQNVRSEDDGPITQAPATPTPKPTWPDHYVQTASLETISHFTGREAELTQLKGTVQSGKNIIAVIGMAGQGKSSLLARWYEQHKDSLKVKKKAIFWCSPYDTGYTYSRFLEEILPYLTDGQFDPREFPSSSEARTDLLCSLLRQRPTLIVLDGLERWLARWRHDPTPSGKDTKTDDRLGADTALDILLADAAGWDNGSAIIFSSRALPAALDGRPVARIGTSGDAEHVDLAPLETDAAVELLKALGVKGDDNELQKAADDYERHALTLRVLAGLLVDLYGGDVGKRPEVDVLDVAEDRGGLKGRLFHLLERIEEHRKDDLPLLDIIACCLVPAPVEMLASLLDKKAGTIRTHLAKLQRWELIHFDPAKGFANLHALLREYFTHRADDELVRKIRCDIATWYASQPIVDQPQRIEEVRPLILAVTHALEGGDVDLGGHFLSGIHVGKDHRPLGEWLWSFGQLAKAIELQYLLIAQYEDLIAQDHPELRNDLANAYNNRGLALRAQGKLDAAIADYEEAIDLRETLVLKENRLELRNKLAGTYNNRGIALQRQGELELAIADYDKAVKLRETLVHKENRLELRNDLASSYNNRGIALQRQCELELAIADYDKAIELREKLVYKENRLELRNHLARAYNNRGNALADQGKLDDAVADYDKAIGLYDTLVNKENRLELRNDMAGTYNNRGGALAAQDKLDAAVADCAKAIEIREKLVHEENRRELAGDLAKVMFGRALAYRKMDRLADAEQDMLRGATLLREMVRNGRVDLLPIFLQASGDLTRLLTELNKQQEAVQWVNEALKMLVSEIQADRVTEVLEPYARNFCADIAGKLEELLAVGLDGESLVTAGEALGVLERQDQPPAGSDET